MNIQKDFPIFSNNKWLVFFDSTSSAQKPSDVIDGMKEYLEHSYSNIHRWAYNLAENSEKLYVDSKKKVAEFIWASNWREVIYTLNTTYAANILVSSIRRTGILKKWDVVLVSDVEHHANIVPWLMMKEDIWIELEFISINDDYSLNLDYLEEKLKNPHIKVVSLTHVSNVTGQIFDLKKAGQIIKSHNENILYFIDASQSVPHFKVDVQELWCDALFFTGHKIMADSGIGVLWWKKEFLEKLRPSIWWGWAISWVKKDSFRLAGLPDKFEPWTPNMTWAVSLLRALEYIDRIGWYEQIEQIEWELVEYFLEKLKQYQNINLIWSFSSKSRVGVFSFNIKGIHSNDVSDYMADNNICIRSGQHCAEPLMIEKWITGSCRVSLYIYNTREEIDRFFEVLDDLQKALW